MSHIISSLPYPIIAGLVLTSLGLLFYSMIKDRKKLDRSYIVMMGIFSLSITSLFLSQTLRKFSLAEVLIPYFQFCSLIFFIVSISILTVKLYKDIISKRLKTKRIFWAVLISWFTVAIILGIAIALTR